jgi:hypothetical protein
MLHLQKRKAGKEPEATAIEKLPHSAALTASASISYSTIKVALLPFKTNSSDGRCQTQK